MNLWRRLAQYWPLFLFLAAQGYYMLNWKWSVDDQFEDAASGRQGIVKAIERHIDDQGVHITSRDRYEFFVTRTEYERDRADDQARVDQLGAELLRAVGEIKELIREDRKEQNDRYKQLVQAITDRQ